MLMSKKRQEWFSFNGNTTSKEDMEQNNSCVYQRKRKVIL